MGICCFKSQKPHPESSKKESARLLSGRILSSLSQNFRDEEIPKKATIRAESVELTVKTSSSFLKNAGFGELAGNDSGLINTPEKKQRPSSGGSGPLISERDRSRIGSGSTVTEGNQKLDYETEHRIRDHRVEKLKSNSEEPEIERKKGTIFGLEDNDYEQPNGGLRNRRQKSTSNAATRSGVLNTDPMHLRILFDCIDLKKTGRVTPKDLLEGLQRVSSTSSTQSTHSQPPTEITSPDHPQHNDWKELEEFLEHLVVQYSPGHQQDAGWTFSEFCNFMHDSADLEKGPQRA